MPMVNGKKYPYTPEGKAAAASAAKRKSKPSGMDKTPMKPDMEAKKRAIEMVQRKRPGTY